MSDSRDERRTPAFPGGSVPSSTLSPAELTDLLAVASGAESRAAFACGMASALLPVVAIAAQEPDLARADRMAYLFAAGILAVSLVAGLATFLDTLALWVATVTRWCRNVSWMPLRNTVAHLARVSLRRRERRRAASRPAARPGRVERLLTRLASPPEHLPPPSQRVQRVLAKSVAAHCAATLAVLGAFVSAAAWLAR